jgi:hypothetical protein
MGGEIKGVGGVWRVSSVRGLEDTGRCKGGKEGGASPPPHEWGRCKPATIRMGYLYFPIMRYFVHQNVNATSRADMST